METEIIDIPEKVKKSIAYASRLDIRQLSKEKFISKYASGTLKTAYEMGADVNKAYLKERVAFEFGNGFEVLPATRITATCIELESYDSAVTEFGWHSKRRKWNLFYGDKSKCLSINTESSDGNIREGLAIVITKTSATWMPKGYIVFALVSEKDSSKKYKNAINPF